MTEMTQAQKLLDALKVKSEDIDHIIVAFSRKGDTPGTIVLGTTGHTPIVWFLGAMDYARWHLFDVLTTNKANQAAAKEYALAEHEFLTQHGVKPS